MAGFERPLDIIAREAIGFPREIKGLKGAKGGEGASLLSPRDVNLEPFHL